MVYQAFLSSSEASSRRPLSFFIGVPSKTLLGGAPASESCILSFLNIKEQGQVCFN